MGIEPFFSFGSAAESLTGKYAVAKEFNVAGSLTFLNVNKTNDRNGKYYDTGTNSSLMDDPANTGGESIWSSPGIQVLPVQNCMNDIEYQVAIWEKVNGIQLVTSHRLLFGSSYHF